MNPQTLLLLPIALEVAAFRTALEAAGEISQPLVIGKIEGFYFPALKLACLQGGYGKTQFAIRAQHALDSAKSFARILCVGTAGSLSASLNPGDLVVATSTVEHDFHSMIGGRRALPEFFGDPELIAKAKTLQTSGFRVHFDKMASGDEDIISPERVTDIKARTSALAVAWEGAGLGRVGKFNQIPHLEIRAISDSANHAAFADFKIHLNRGMQNAASFVQQLLGEHR